MSLTKENKVCRKEIREYWNLFTVARLTTPGIVHIRAIVLMLRNRDTELLSLFQSHNLLWLTEQILLMYQELLSFQYYSTPIKISLNNFIDYEWLRLPKIFLGGINLMCLHGTLDNSTRKLWLTVVRIALENIIQLGLQHMVLLRHQRRDSCIT